MIFEATIVINIMHIRSMQSSPLFGVVNVIASVVNRHNGRGLFSLLSAIQGTITASKANITQVIKFTRRNCARSSVEHFADVIFRKVADCTRGEG